MSGIFFRRAAVFICCRRSTVVVAIFGVGVAVEIVFVFCLRYLDERSMLTRPREWFLADGARTEGGLCRGGFVRYVQFDCFGLNVIVNRAERDASLRLASTLRLSPSPSSPPPHAFVLRVQYA